MELNTIGNMDSRYLIFSIHSQSGFVIFLYLKVCDDNELLCKNLNNPSNLIIGSKNSSAQLIDLIYNNVNINESRSDINLRRTI